MRPPIPATLADTLTTEWLTSALSVPYPGLRVTDVVIGPVVSRVSTNARFSITVEGPLPAGLSSDLCIKGYYEDYGQRPVVVGLKEALFYRDLADRTGVHTLHAQYADGDEATGACAIVTDDLVAQGGQFLDPLQPYSVDDVAISLEQLAALHASTWMDPTCGRATWLDPWFERLGITRGVKEISHNFSCEIGAGVPTAVRDPDLLYDGFLEVAHHATNVDPWCAVHADTHAANLFRDATGKPGWVDWQLVQRGPWYLDVGYHLGSALDIEQRRVNERALLSHYLEHLGSLGAPAPTEAEAWDDIRYGMIHGFYLWGITMIIDPAITTVMLERLGTAVDDHAAFACVGR